MYALDLGMLLWLYIESWSHSFCPVPRPRVARPASGAPAAAAAARPAGPPTAPEGGGKVELKAIVLMGLSVSCKKNKGKLKYIQDQRAPQTILIQTK